MNQWLRSELLSSLTEEHWKSKDLSIPENHVWDVQLTVNGIECEPVLLGDLLHNIEAIIDRQAQSLIEEKVAALEDKLREETATYLDNLKDILVL